MRFLMAAALCAALASAAGTGPVTFTPPGQPMLELEATEVGGTQCIALDDFISAVRTVDPLATVRWESAQRLRMDVLGSRVTMFTERAAILVENFFHGTEGPLVTRSGDFFVPASVLRDLFEYLPSAPAVEVTLPEGVGTSGPDAQVPPTTTILPPLPPSAGSVNLPPMDLTPLIPPPGVMPGGDQIIIVTVNPDEDEGLIAPIRTLIQAQVSEATGRAPVSVTAEEEDWSAVIAAIAQARPRAVIALQLGHAAKPEIRGSGLFYMSPVVDPGSLQTASQSGAGYRAGALGSEMLAQQIERAVTSASLPWLGAVPAPHRLLRACSSPAVLVELGQAESEADRASLGDAGHQSALAEAIASAIVEFVSMGNPSLPENV